MIFLRFVIYFANSISILDSDRSFKNTNNFIQLQQIYNLSKF